MGPSASATTKGSTGTTEVPSIKTVERAVKSGLTAPLHVREQPADLRRQLLGNSLLSRFLGASGLSAAQAVVRPTAEILAGAGL